MTAPLPHTLHVDTHVHLHDAFDVAEQLNAAVGHFQDARAELGVLCLTEHAHQQAYDRLRQSQRYGRWTFEPRGDGRSLYALRDDGAELGLVQGQQVLAEDRLEVLILGGRPGVADGMSFKATLRAARETGLGVVVPWGFGKWTGARGELIHQVIDTRPPGVALGDNGGRPKIGLGDGLLRHGRQMGMLVLPGSDPLAIASGKDRAGSVGVVISGPPTWDELADTLAALPSRAVMPDTYGSHCGVLRAISQQISLRLRGQRQSLQPVETAE